MAGESKRRVWGARIAAVGLMALAVPFFGQALTGNADAGCNGVFNGKTPSDPIVKFADKSEVEIGDTVTFTVQWHSTGTDTANVRDCYRIDDGDNDALNALVEGFNQVKEVANVGPKGTLQSTTFTVTVPDSSALVGHNLVDRAKITRGSKESRSGLVSVAIVGHPVVVDDDDDDDTEVLDERTHRPKVLTGRLARTGPETSIPLNFGIAFMLMGAATMLFARSSTPRLREAQRTE